MSGRWCNVRVQCMRRTLSHRERFKTDLERLVVVVMVAHCGLFCRRTTLALDASAKLCWLWSESCNGTWTFSNINWYMHFIFGIICFDHFLNINKTEYANSHACRMHHRCRCRTYAHMNKVIYFICLNSSFHLQIMQNSIGKQASGGSGGGSGIRQSSTNGIWSTVSNEFPLCTLHVARHTKHFMRFVRKWI